MAECSIDFDGATNAHAAETTINIQKIDLALFTEYHSKRRLHTPEATASPVSAMAPPIRIVRISPTTRHAARRGNATTVSLPSCSARPTSSYHETGARLLLPLQYVQVRRTRLSSSKDSKMNMKRSQTQHHIDKMSWSQWQDLTPTFQTLASKMPPLIRRLLVDGESPTKINHDQLLEQWESIRSAPAHLGCSKGCEGAGIP